MENKSNITNNNSYHNNLIKPEQNLIKVQQLSNKMNQLDTIETKDNEDKENIEELTKINQKEEHKKTIQ